MRVCMPTVSSMGLDVLLPNHHPGKFVLLIAFVLNAAVTAAKRENSTNVV